MRCGRRNLFVRQANTSWPIRCGLGWWSKVAITRIGSPSGCRRGFREPNVGADLAALASGISSFDQATPSRRLQGGRGARISHGECRRGLGRACVGYIFIRRSDAKSSPTTRNVGADLAALFVARRYGVNAAMRAATVLAFSPPGSGTPAISAAPRKPNMYRRISVLSVLLITPFWSTSSALPRCAR